VPPFVGVAVKVSETPLQVGLVPAVNAMDTEGVTGVITENMSGPKTKESLVPQ
jgi:hypothetical protein